jgi:hypothetical protein
MAFDQTAGGHRFDFSRMACTRCEMSWEKFGDTGRPQCKGRPRDKKERLTIPPDDDPPGAA